MLTCVICLDPVFIADEQMTYTEATTYCQNQGATIVVPINKDEIDKIRDMIPAHGDVRAWLGIEKATPTSSRVEILRLRRISA